MTDLFHRVATAPISWGVCEVPGWGVQLPVDRVLTEMAGLGFTHTELGSVGWLPGRPDELRATLDRHGLSLLAAFVPLVLHDRSMTEATLDQAAGAAQLLEDLGGTCFNTAPVTSPDWAPRRPLSDNEWEHTYDMVGRLEELCTSHGLTQVIHEHVGCTVETAEEVERLLEHTSARFVLDTGHLALGGYDPLRFARDHASRVGLVHLKDLRPEVGEQLNASALSLMEAVQQGLFPALGEGHLPLTEIVTVLEAGGYTGWYVIEQDCAITGEEPAAGTGPVADMGRSLGFLTGNITAFADGNGLASSTH
jgi:inosose dehydratase